jgi:Protein of unknown function (DUF3592)
LRPILIWLALFLCITTFLFGQNVLNTLRVMRSHETVEGTITELLSEHHRTVIASYDVGEHHFTTATSLPEQLGLQPFEQLKVGDKVKIEYDPTAPDKGILGSAEKLFVSDLKDIGLIGVFLLFAAAYFEFNIRKYIRKSREAM